MYQEKCNDLEENQKTEIVEVSYSSGICLLVCLKHGQDFSLNSFLGPTSGSYFADGLISSSTISPLF